MNPLDPGNTNNQVIWILKYYIYKCGCLGDISSINDGLKRPGKKQKTISFLSSSQKEDICKKWLPWCLKFQCSAAKCIFL
jgi:hypothetical protein